MGFFNKLFGKKNKIESNIVIDVHTPVNGEVVSTSKVKDETFSQNMIGKGFAIIPSDGEFVAPIDGELTLVAATGHAFSIKHESGIEVLVHIGIDTVNINSNKDPNDSLVGFSIHKKAGDIVKIGDPIITADLKLIKAKGFDTITPVVVVNNEHTGNKNISDLLISGKQTKSTKAIEIK